MSGHLLLITTLLYTVASSCYLAYLLAPNEWLSRSATWSLSLGVAVHVVTIVDRWIELGVTPIHSTGEVISTFTLVLAAVYLGIQLRTRRAILGAFVVPVAALAMVTASMLPAAGSEIPEALRDTWLPIHISMALLGDAALAVAAAISLSYLIVETRMKRKKFGGVFARLPSLESLDDLNYGLVRFGFILLTLAIVTGTFWAGRTWGTYFSFEPRQVLAIVAWGVYASLIVSRWVAGWRGRRAAILTMVGFVILVGSFAALKAFDIGRHGGNFA